MVQTFQFALPTRVLFGPGVSESVGQEAARLGSRALLVTGGAFATRSGLLIRIVDSLEQSGVPATVFDRIEPDASYEVLDAGGKMARECGADLVVGVGGGAVLDGAKAIAAAARLDRSIREFTRLTAENPPALPGALPVVQVPIIASTGSEANATAVIYDPEAGARASLTDPALAPAVAVVDPALTFSVPSRYTAVGGINIVSGLLETYLTSDEFSARDRMIEGLLRVVMDALARAMRNGDDLDARTNLSWAAAVASSVARAGGSGYAPVRAMALPVTARFGAEYGAVAAALWPSFMRYALANRLRLPQIGRFKRYALLGRQIFGVHETDDEVAAEIATHRFLSWLVSAGMQTDLRHLDLQPEVVGELASQAVTISGNGRRLPSGLTEEDVQNIYEGTQRVY